MFRPSGCRLLRWNEVLLLQFADGVIVTLEEAQDGHVTQGLGGGVQIVGNWKVVVFVAYRAQMLYKTVSEYMLGLTDVEEATSGAADTVNQIDGCAGEHLSNVEDAVEAEQLGVGDYVLAGGWMRGGVCSQDGAFDSPLPVANHFNSPQSDMSILGLLQCHNDTTCKLEE
eukprot:g18810.t1